MRNRRIRIPYLLALAVALLGGWVHVVQAVDGVVLIDQTRALAGNITPGDASGFPVTISKPGSYRLTGNLTVPFVHITAIQITVDNVTLDLNGFTILGPTVCSGDPLACNPSMGDEGGRGVDAVNRSNITVINGTVRGMGQAGLFLGPSSRVEKVNAMSNGAFGIVASSSSTVLDSTASFNSEFGIIASGTVINNTADGNGIAGILNHGTTTNNTVSENQGGGIRVSGTVVGNTVMNNDGNGIEADGSVSGNTVHNNNGVGINVNDGVVIGNTVNNNGGLGLNLSPGAGYINNVLINNNGGNANPQVSGGIQLGTNICGTSLCP